MTRVAFVIQRYGSEIIGGAESYTRQLAFALSKEFGWQIDIHTSCSDDYLRWDNTRSSGRQTEEGITVYRYKSWTLPRIFFKIYKRLFRVLRLLPIVPRILEVVWIRLQGPFCPEMIDQLTTHAQDYKVIFAFTYLYYPSREVGLRLGKRVILVPFAHDEEAFYFPGTHDLLREVARIMPVSAAERQLIERTYPLLKTTLLPPAGIGVDTGYFMQRHAFPRKPQMLYLGRVGRGKGVDVLLRDYAELHKAYPDMKLILAGYMDRDFELPDVPWLVHRGVVSDQEKSQLIHESLALINPSQHESLSLVILEALSVGTAVLANRACAVFADYARQVPTVFLYDNASTLINAFEDLQGKTAAQDEWGESLNLARSFVQKNYSWSRTCEVYRMALNQLSPASTDEELAKAVFHCDQ